MEAVAEFVTNGYGNPCSNVTWKPHLTSKVPVALGDY
jgi:hypothetical protein